MFAFYSHSLEAKYLGIKNMIKINNHVTRALTNYEVSDYKLILNLTVLPLLSEGICIASAQEPFAPISF